MLCSVPPSLRPALAFGYIFICWQTSLGGWKRSLFGDHAIYGPEGVRFYTRLKTITARCPTGIRAGVDTSMPTLG